jgi:hypothetical protein
LLKSDKPAYLNKPNYDPHGNTATHRTNGRFLRRTTAKSLVFEAMLVLRALTV